MSKNPCLQKLIDIGLSEKEAQVYFGSLNKGPASITELAKASGIKRTSLYHVINSMIRKNIIRKELHGIKELYVANDPDNLLRVLKEKENNLSQIIPDLKALQKSNYNESIIRIYPDKKACKEVYLDLLKNVRPQDEYLVIGSANKMTKLYPEFFPEFLKTRSEMNLKVKMILESDPASLARGKKYKNETNKFLKPGTNLTTNVVILPDRVWIHQLSEPMSGMLFFNPDIIALQRELFKLVWESI